MDKFEEYQQEMRCLITDLVTARRDLMFYRNNGDLESFNESVEGALFTIQRLFERLITPGGGGATLD